MVWLVFAALFAGYALLAWSYRSGPAWPRRFQMKDGPVEFQACPSCHHRAAFINPHDGLLTCAWCGLSFHEDFGRFVKRLKVVPDPPRKQTDSKD